jgi:glycosyltransferase involved in cell wall biosynthesis
MEATACGCVCVSSNIGGCRDIISHNNTGILFATDNVEQLIFAITKLINMPNQLESVRMNPVEFCQKILDIKLLTLKIIDIFAGLKKSKVILNDLEKNPSLVSLKHNGINSFSYLYALD